MKELDLSIIIVSYNTRDLLRKCINYVYGSTNNLNYEISVVDNASSDGSPNMVASEFPDVILIRNKKNLGFAKANNQAIKVAKGRYLLLLNSDAVLKVCAIEELVCFMEAHPSAAAVGPRVLNTDGSLQSKGFNFPSVVMSLLDLVRVTTFLQAESLGRLFPKYFWDEHIVRPVDWISGCCMLMRGNIVDKIGCLSEDFFMYYEDVEWCRRAWNRGYEIWYYGQAEIIHNNLASPFPSRAKQIRLAARTYYKITNSLLDGIIISIMRIMFYVTRLIRLFLQTGVTQEIHCAKQSLKDEVAFLMFLVGYHF